MRALKRQFKLYALLSLLAKVVSAPLQKQLFIEVDSYCFYSKVYKFNLGNWGVLFYCASLRRDKRKRPASLKVDMGHTENQKSQSPSVFASSFSNTSVGPLHFFFITLSLSLSMWVSFGSMLPFPISREWRATLRGTVGGQTARNLSAWSQRFLCCQGCS